MPITVNGHIISDSQIQAAFTQVGSLPFTLADFASALEATGVSADIAQRAARKALQQARKDGLAAYDPGQHAWRRTTPSAPVQLPNAKPVPLPSGTLPMPGQGQSSVHPVLQYLAALACFGAIGAVVTINAVFGLSLAEGTVFRITLVVGLVSADLLRPLMALQAALAFDRGRRFRGLAILAAVLLLGSVSMLSSYSTIAASMETGHAAKRAEADAKDIRTRMLAESIRLDSLARTHWQTWREECQRGGCGPRARNLERTARETETRARQTREALEALPAKPVAAFQTRVVAALAGLGVGDLARIIPLLLAVALELAAILGPVVVLRRG